MRNVRGPSEALGWGAFLLVGGVVFLLHNFGLFGPWLAWIAGAVFAVAGLAFLVRFATSRRQWWLVIPAFTLLGLAATVLLGERGLVPQAWLATVFLGSIGLGFWLLFALDRAHWWAVMPGGMLWVIGVIAAVNQTTRLNDYQQGGLLFIGLGLIFGILYLLRNAQRPLGWAAIPALALILFGAVVLTAERSANADLIGRLWPLLLVAIGLGLLLGQLRAVGTVTVTIPTPGKKAPKPVVEPEPAPAVAVTDLPTVGPAAAGAPAEGEKPGTKGGPSEPAPSSSADAQL
jgi:hypothetical protein